MGEVETKQAALTEVEIFDCLRTNFHLAAENCEKLAVRPKEGMIYRNLRDQLKLLEGACRQAAYWRGGDARWLKIGLYMAEAHKRAGDWLRGIKQPDGSRTPLAPGHRHPLFMKLADNLRAAHARAEEYRTKKTGRIGPILPVAQEAPHRDTRPVHVSVPPSLQFSKGGIILPPRMTV